MRAHATTQRGNEGLPNTVGADCPQLLFEFLTRDFGHIGKAELGERRVWIETLPFACLVMGGFAVYM